MRIAHLLGVVGALTAVGGCGPRAASRSAPPPSASVVADRAPDATGGRSTPAPAAWDDAVESVEDWSYDSTPGRVIRTTHYRLFTTETDAALVSRMPGFLEAALAHCRSALTPLPAPPMRLDSFLMDNRPQWKRLTLHLLGREGEPYLNIGRGGFATGGRALFYDIGLFDTLSLAAHEGWHQYTQRTFREPLPVWLEEGLAVFMEGHKWEGPRPLFLPWANLERFDHLRAASSKSELVSLPALLDSAPQDFLNRAGDGVLTYYAQLWALTHFLTEPDRRENLEALLRDACHGKMADRVARAVGAHAALEALRSRRGSAVFLAYFGKPDAAADAYAAYMTNLTLPGGRDRVAAGESPIRR